jgi:hypothetical protein
MSWASRTARRTLSCSWRFGTGLVLPAAFLIFVPFHCSNQNYLLILDGCDRLCFEEAGSPRDLRGFINDLLQSCSKMKVALLFTCL